MKALYSNDKTKQIDQLAAQALGIDSFELMQKAGAAVFQHVKYYQRLLVVTGPGNNGGDGFVIAQLARNNNQQVTVLCLQPVEALSGDARKAAEMYQGSLINEWPESSFDCVVDAVFGTGLQRAVSGRYAEIVERINQSTAHVLAVDIPSGLNGTTGQIEGCAVQADQTIAILAPNTGLFTAAGKSCCGQVVLEDLDVPAHVYAGVTQTAELLSKSVLKKLQNSRHDNSHKGSFGHVLTVGGQAGMLGAVLLAGRAVLKSGAGLTTVVTDSSHANLLSLSCPELMTFGFDGLAQQNMSERFVEKDADVLLLGMGLGQSQWSKQLFQRSVQTRIPLVIDADGLSLLARSPQIPDQLAVITPHPKEAAVLLNKTVEDIQGDRWSAVSQLARQYQCVAVLKGSGTLISDGENTWCCPYGSANLATAGSGDVLAGMVAGLLAQGFGAAVGAQIAVVWHARAGERSAFGLSLTASDLIDSLHHEL